MLGVLLAIFFAALVFVLVSIIKFKLHLFLALLLGGLLMGILAGMPLDKTAAAMAAGFGGTMQGIGIIIVLGVALGTLLHVSGCTSQIAALLLRATGTAKKRARSPASFSPSRARAVRSARSSTRRASASSLSRA